ncbi:MAG: RNA-binding cell elongation regulator Jag/EloR [Candidatus Eremiobacteraeota bacterium]|nr:RNA-binding cell elongation regulator Jag/EloR [Candidatus Eremiobacteraeota bacterium]
MKVVEEYGRTVEEAKKAALEKLGASADDKRIEVEVIDEGSKGVLGWGTKFARVRVKFKEEAEDKAEEVISTVLKILDLTGEIEKESVEGQLHFNVVGGDLGLLIGRRGQTLEALQFIVNLIVNRDSKEKMKIVLDVEGYRSRREKSLQDLARRLAEKARQERKNVVLEPMMANERRLIHLALQDNPHVSTFSQGEEPLRKVVISPKKTAS